MIPKILRYAFNVLLTVGLAVLSFWMIGFFMPFYRTSAVMDVDVPMHDALMAWKEMSRMAEWSDRFRRVIRADSVELIAEDSIGTAERWSVIQYIAPDSLVVRLDREDYHMVNFIRFESRDTTRTTVRRWVRIHPHGAWFDSWFFFVKSRYVDQIESENQKFKAFLHRSQGTRQSD